MPVLFPKWLAMMVLPAYLVKPGSSESIAREISALLDAPQKRLGMGIEGRKRVTNLFTWRRTAERTADLYYEAIAARRDGSCKP